MARRPLMQREVMEVAVPQDAEGEMYQDLQSTMSEYEGLQRKKELANIKTYMSQANADMLQLTNQWRVDNQSDPSSQEALGKLHSGYDKILTQYGQKVGMFGKRDWLQVTERLKAQYRSDNVNWADHQTTVNAENGINGGIEKDMQIYRQLGSSFDYDKLQSSFSNSMDVLNKFGTQVLGTEKTSTLLKDYKSDSVTMFIYGGAESNPFKAEMLLNQEKIRADIGDPNKIDALRRFIARQKELKRQGVELAQNEAEDQMIDNFLQDKLTIMDLSNASKKDRIRPEFAQSMKEALLSDKAVGAMTDDKEFMKAVDMLFDTKKDLEHLDMHLVSQISNGKMSAEDAKIVRLFAKNVAKGKAKKRIEKMLPQTIRHKNNGDVIKFWGEQYERNPGYAIASMWKQYIQLVNDGKPPADALNEVINYRKRASSYKPGDKEIFNGRTYQLRGFYADGEPDFVIAE